MKPEQLNIDVPALFRRWTTLCGYYLSEKTAAGATDFSELNRFSAHSQVKLFSTDTKTISGSHQLSVDPKTLKLLKVVSCHNQPDRWQKMYAVVLREQKRPGGSELLTNSADLISRQFMALYQQVRHDRHKMTAFVRFRKVSADKFHAFHLPEHYITELTANFFKSRFSQFSWEIQTPSRSVIWDGAKLSFGAGVASDPQADAEDQYENMWCNYYQSIFNPGRVKRSAMLNQMPKKYWQTMPETRQINQMLRDAPGRVRQMQKYNSHDLSTTRAPFISDADYRAQMVKYKSWVSQFTPCTVESSAKKWLLTDQPLVIAGKFICPLQVLGALLPDSDLSNFTAVYFLKQPNYSAETAYKTVTLAMANRDKGIVLNEIRLFKPIRIWVSGNAAYQSLMGRTIDPEVKNPLVLGVELAPLPELNRLIISAVDGLEDLRFESIADAIRSRFPDRVKTLSAAFCPTEI